MTRFVPAALAAALLASPLQAADTAPSFEQGSAAWRDGDSAAAYAIWHPLAQSGDRDAQFNLGVLLAYGLGIDEDRPEALDWLQKAADQGDTIAAFNVGVLLSEHESPHQNYSRAADYYERAAAAEHPGAMEDLSILLANGLGVDRDLGRAVRLSADAQDLECLVGDTKGNFVPRLTRLTN